jgi:hypothetical protein
VRETLTGRAYGRRVGDVVTTDAVIERDLIADAQAALAASAWPEQVRSIGAVAALGGEAPLIVSAARAAALDAERAAMRTVALAGSSGDPAFVAAVIEEVKRRAQIFGSRQAWDSVSDDLAAGRWRA